MSQKNRVPVSSANMEKVLIEQMMDVDNSEPLLQRLGRLDISRRAIKEVVGGSAFEDELYEHCRGEILLPAMAKILNSLVAKAAGGSIQATRTYLELMKRLNTKQDVNVNILQYQGLSDSELDRRLEAEMRRHGIGGEDGFITLDARTEGETPYEIGGDEEGQGGEEA